jgi:hypothetical protein
MLDYLATVYSDPHKELTALKDFRQLYQGSDPFHKFWADFMRLAVQLEMTDRTLMIELRNRVNVDIQKAIVMTVAENVQDLAKKCLLAESNLDLVIYAEKRLAR